MLFYEAHALYHLGATTNSLTTAAEMGGAVTFDTWRLYHHLIRVANLAELGRLSQGGNNEIKAVLSIAAMRKQFENSKNHPENRRIWLESLSKAGLS